MGKFKAAGIEIVGISRDSLASHTRFREKYGFTFPLLADTGFLMLKAYGAWGEKKSAGKVKEGPIRTTIVVDGEGNVEKIYPKVKAKGHAQIVLEDLT